MLRREERKNVKKGGKEGKQDRDFQQLSSRVEELSLIFLFVSLFHGCCVAHEAAPDITPLIHTVVEPQAK